MKKLKFFYYLIAVSLLAGCGADDSTTAGDGGIVADFSFTNDGSLFTFTNLSKGATTYRWDFGDLSFYCDKENPTYRYTKVGGEIKVTLTAMNDSGQEAYVTKTVVAPEVKNIKIDIDGKFDDWADVDVLYDESGSGSGSMQKIKIWGGGDNINIYIEGNKSMLMELVDMYINSDGNPATGYQIDWMWPGGSGADFLFEGPMVNDSWGGLYKHSDPSGGWGWDWVGGNMTFSGLVSVDSQTNAIEFRIPKSDLGALGSTFSIAIVEMTGGWGLVANFPEVTDTSSFITYELPKESLGLCQ